MYSEDVHGHIYWIHGFQIAKLILSQTFFNYVHSKEVLKFYCDLAGNVTSSSKMLSSTVIVFCLFVLDFLF